MPESDRVRIAREAYSAYETGKRSRAEVYFGWNLPSTKTPETPWPN
jgi:hypothetical protein